MKVAYAYFLSLQRITVTALALVFVITFSAPAQISFFEGFDQGGPYPANNLPLGWTQGTIVWGSPFNTFQRQSPGTLPTVTAISAPAVLTYRSWNAPSGESAFVCSKAFDLSTRGAASTNFRFSIYRSGGWAGYLDNIQVYVNTAPTLTGALLLADTATGLTAINRCYLDAPLVASVNWYKYGYTIPAGPPYTATRVYVLIRGNSQFGENIHMDNFSISQYPTNMTFTSTAMVFQNTACISPGSTGWIVAIRIIAAGAGTPYGFDSINFNTNGSTSPCSDIVSSGAKLWWTGGTKTLDLTIAQQVGVGAAVCGTNYKFVPAPGFRLDNDTNYFWITYDISPGATIGNCVDAEYLSVDLAFGAAGNTLKFPTIGTLPGCRQIGNCPCIPVYSNGTSTGSFINQVIMVGESGYPPGINNLTGANPNPDYYTSFPPVSGMTAVLKADGISNYTLMAQTGTAPSSNCIAAWIDFNHDGDFYDIGEKVVQSPYPPGLSNNAWWNQSFIVQTNSYIGSTALRVRETFASGNINPCANYVYGETEDYTITIIPDCNIIPALIGWSIWLGGISDDWDNPVNWCGGVPNSTKNAIVIDSATASAYLGGAPSPVAPAFFPVIKNGVTAAAKKLRIEGADSVTINAPVQGAAGSLNIYDSLNINNATGKLKVISSLTDTARISNGTLLNPNAYPFAGSACKQRMQVLFTQTEFLAKGLIAGDVIDELHFWISTKASTMPYSNFNISYYYTSSSFNFSPAMTGWAPVSALGATIYTGAVTTPASGTKLTIPLIPNSFIWSGATNQVVIDICWDNGATVSFNDQTTYTQTVGFRKCAIVRVLSPPGAAPAGCVLLPTSPGNIVKIGTDQRPNITFKFHRNYGKYPINMRGSGAGVAGGHWGNNGTFDQGVSIVTFMGTTGTQNIDGTTLTTFHELAINNAGHVRQNTSTNVEDTLFLFNGRFILNKVIPTAVNMLTLNLGTPAAITKTNGFLQSESVPPDYGMLRWQMGANTALHQIPFITASGTSIFFEYTATGGTTDLTIGTYVTSNANLPAPTLIQNASPVPCLIYYPNIYTGLDNSANMVDRFWLVNNTGTVPVANMTFRFAPAEAPGAGTVVSQRWDSITCWQLPMPGQSSTATSNTTPNVSVFNSIWALSHLTPVAIITPAGPTTFCLGSNVVLNANTGTGLTYQWLKNGINILGGTSSAYAATSSGSYTVQVTGAFGSAVSSPVIVTINSLPQATITTAGPVTFCQGGSVVLNANTGVNLAYQWKKNGNNISGATSSIYSAISSGTYTVIVTNTLTGCTKTSHIAIAVTVNPKPSATITPSGTITFCAGQSALLTANSGAGYTYKWKKNGNYISGATAITYIVTTAGKYKVEVTNSNGCSKTSDADTVVVPCRIGEGENEGGSKFDMSISPNPSTGIFTIHFSEKPSTAFTIEITDVIGKAVDRFAVSEETFMIDKSNLAGGIYYLSAKTNEVILVKKIVIQ